MNLSLTLMMLLIVKHFVADFLLQPPYMYLNKGTYGHNGGILHAWVHGVLTVGLLCIINIYDGTDNINLVLFLGFLDFFIHYHVDFFKVKINKVYNLKPDNDKFWVLLGIDQFLHYATYIGITHIWSIK